MKIDQLRHFYEIASAGSFTRAAERLYLSQPTLSESITKLEGELGERLFTRQKTGVTLTSYGRELLPYAKNVLDLVDQMPIKLDTGRNRVQRFSVSTGSSRCFSEAVGVLYAAHKERGIRIDFHNEGKEESLTTVQNGNAEIGYYSFWDFQRSTTMKRLEAMEIEFVPLTEEPLTIAVGPMNPLYNVESDFVTLDQIKQYSFFVSYNESDRLLSKRLGLTNDRNLVFFYGSGIGFDRMLEFMDCILINVPFGREQSFDVQRHYRVLQIADIAYRKQVGYIKRRDVPLSPIGEEFVVILKKLS
ncbi:MAG: LysR family transcriptional regulator [Oscillospiraceae bacterium]|nr:LysR family transcriptional regulator [Oscillospiraceae bacterium]